MRFSDREFRKSIQSVASRYGELATIHRDQCQIAEACALARERLATLEPGEKREQFRQDIMWMLEQTIEIMRDDRPIPLIPVQRDEPKA